MEHVIEMIFENQQAHLNILLRQIDELQTMAAIIVGCVAGLTIIGLMIILNQRKLRKELRQIRKMMEKDNKDVS